MESSASPRSSVASADKGTIEFQLMCAIVPIRTYVYIRIRTYVYIRIRIRIRIRTYVRHSSQIHDSPGTLAWEFPQAPLQNGAVSVSLGVRLNAGFLPTGDRQLVSFFCCFFATGER